MQRSAIHHRHLLFIVARAGDLLGRKRRVERRHLLGIERHVRPADVLLEIAPMLCAGDRHDVRTLVQEPRERDLSRRAALPIGDSRTVDAARMLASKFSP